MSDQSPELAGLTAVVTGSSSGIGRAIAIELAHAGADCLIHAGHNIRGAAETADAVRQLGRQSHSIIADLSDPKGHDQFIKKARAWHDQIDIWVNNAGADVLTGEAAHWPFERKMSLLWQVDVEATLALSRSIGETMKSRGQGVIINMGWDRAFHGMAGDSGELFGTTKGAVMAFSMSLARSLAPQVRVNCVAPGWIQTAWGADASDYWQQRAQDESLLARWGTPEDVAKTVRFLASPAAAFITGQVIPVNGGLK